MESIVEHIALLLIGLFFICLVLLIFRKIHKTKKKILETKKKVVSILQEAVNAPTDIRPFETSEADTLYSGNITEVSEDGINVELKKPFPERLVGSTVTVYYRIQKDVQEEDIFKWFRSTVKEAGENVYIDVPSGVALGQKRLFMRMVPKEEDINIMTLWKMRFGQPLPDFSNQTGVAIAYARPGNLGFEIANISGSGVALSFSMQNDKPPILPGDFALLFIAFRYPGSIEPVYCWLYGECINQRIIENKAIISMKFLNWASPKNIDDELAWFLCVDEFGVPPIVQWVKKNGY